MKSKLKKYFHIVRIPNELNYTVIENHDYNIFDSAKYIRDKNFKVHLNITERNMIKLVEGGWDEFRVKYPTLSEDVWDKMCEFVEGMGE